MRTMRVLTMTVTIALMVGIDALMLYCIFPEWYKEGIRSLLALLP